MDFIFEAKMHHAIYTHQLLPPLHQKEFEMQPISINLNQSISKEIRIQISGNGRLREKKWNWNPFVQKYLTIKRTFNAFLFATVFSLMSKPIVQGDNGTNQLSPDRTMHCRAYIYMCIQNRVPNIHWPLNERTLPAFKL